MDHTEGFDEIDENEIENEFTTKDGSVKKGRRSNGNSNNTKSKTQNSSQDINEVRALAKKKRISFQLETLAEFADSHLKISTGGDLTYINLLSEACLLKRPSKVFFIIFFIF